MSINTTASKNVNSQEMKFEENKIIDDDNHNNNNYNRVAESKVSDNTTVATEIE